jgi:siroheme synthase-like protein
MAAFPLMLNDGTSAGCGRRVGGSSQGGGLSHAGGGVRLVCLEPRPADYASQPDWQMEPYRPEHLDGACLVFAAATPEVNRVVVADARARGRWVNSATEPAEGDFTVPAVVRRGNFLLTVSTGGASPALARAARERLEELFDERFAQWVAILEEIRPMVMARVADEVLRRKIFAAISAWRWLDRLRIDGPADTRSAMLAQVWLILSDAGKRV